MKSIFRHAFAASLFVLAIEASAQESFTRLVHNDKTRESLETRAVKLVPENGQGPIIWLVSAAHIGQASYYKSIQGLLDAQSLVLYEGVKGKAPVKPSVQPAKKQPFPNQDKSTYNLFAGAVGLDFQLKDIDYNRPTFKNCDLTWAEVTALSSKQGAGTAKSVDTIGKLLDSDSQEGKAFGAFLQEIKSDPGSQEAMRVVLTEALSKPGITDKFLGGATSEVLIKNRNDKVITELGRQTSQSSVAIFFGAAHMPDMEHRIITEKHYKVVEDKWFSAITSDTSKVSGKGTAILAAFRTLLGVSKS